MAIRKSAAKKTESKPKPKPAAKPVLNDAVKQDVIDYVLQGVINEAFRRYEGTLVLPRMRELIAFMREFISTYEATSDNSSAEGDSK